VVGLMNLVHLGQEQIGQALEQPVGSHADELETSLMLAIDENLVDMAKATRDFGLRTSRGLISSPSIMPARDAETGQELSGIYGDATLAAKEKGEQYWEIIFSHLDGIREFISQSSST